MNKKFLVVVDTQYDFVMPDGLLYVGGAEEIIVPGIKFLANLDPDEYSGVLFTYDTHYRATYFDLPESKEFPIHCIRGTAGHANVFNPSLVSGNIATLDLIKGVFSMWEEPHSEEAGFIGNSGYGDRNPTMTWARDKFFEDMKASGTETIQVMGVASDYCVKWAVDGFVQRGFNVEVLQELCRGIAQPASDVFDVYPTVKLV
jgi:nicotinamidase/pyrazinamidase